METVCKMVGKELLIIPQIIKYMSTNQAQVLIRIFMSQFSYCLFIWMCHSRLLNNQINKLHERTLRLVSTIKALLFGNLLKDIIQSLLMKEIFKYGNIQNKKRGCTTNNGRNFQIQRPFISSEKE